MALRFADRDEEEENAIRKLENAVDIMTDMAHIRRSSHSHDKNKSRIEISPALVKEVIEAFDLFDKKKLHGLDIEELATAFRAVGQNPTDAELREIMKQYDLNGKGVLNREEFEEMIKKFMKPLWQVEEELRDAFRIFDADGTGTIDTRKLEYVLKKFGEPLNHRQSRELVTLMDKDGSGQVDVKAFVSFLCEVDNPDFYRTHYPHSPRRNSLVQGTEQ